MIQMGFSPLKVKTTTTMFDGSIFGGKTYPNRQSEENILFLSRLTKEKGVYELLEAFKIISEKFPGVRLSIAGDGPELSEMKKRVAKNRILCERVSFLGYVKGKEKGDLLLASQVFIFPTYHGEGCPVSLLEAMAGGLAVVSTPIAAIPDIVEQNINGILISDVKPETIARAIFRFLEDRDFCYKVRSNNCLKAWKNYETEKVSQLMVGIYSEVMKT